MKCDIIIPIYNAYEALCECIESVIKNTDLKENNLILINDKSTDERIIPFLRKIVKENKNLNINIIDNKENLGFVGTVNIGMKKSNNDVLLLNSDTEVSKNWLENIKKCAYSGEKIATVTPLSNNATLASVPNGLQKNEIPEGYTLEEYAELVAKVSLLKYPELPTAHGFCMYIKREILNLIGYFDEEAFGKGYGEENDFSYRCLDYGYRNILCDNVYVYHKEKQSFSEQREILCCEHQKILDSRYPTYVQNQKNWCADFPIKYIGDNIVFQIELKKRKNILIIIHDWEDITGGTTLHVKDIIDGLKNNYNFHILSYTETGYKLFSYMGDYEKNIKLKYIKKTSILPRYNDEYKEMLCDIVESLGISAVHIHHMFNHYFDIIDVIKKYNLSSSVTLHDFYSICPTIFMIYKGTVFCEYAKDKKCSECLKMSLNISNDILDDWHHDWERLFSNVDNVITPSIDTKKRIQKVYPNTIIKAIDHGIDLDRIEARKRNNDKVFNVAYVGVLGVHKGQYIIEKLLKQTKNRKIKYHLFGKCENKKLNKSKGNYTYHGKYKRQDIGRLLKESNIHLIILPQIWPETYSYIVTEVIASGIPVLIYDVGAGAERVKDNKLGWTIPLSFKPNDIIKTIVEIMNDKDGYNEIIDSINKYKIKTVKEMNENYKKIYSCSKNVSFVNEKLEDLLINGGRSNNVENDKLEAILNSTRWKLISKINFSPKTTYYIRKIIRKEKK